MLTCPSTAPSDFFIGTSGAVNPPAAVLALQADGWFPGSPPMATEWTIEARAGGTCVLRIVQSLFASTDEWDNELEGAKAGWSGFLATLRVYLAHFRGQRLALAQLRNPAAGSDAEIWDALITALGLQDMRVGQRVSVELDPDGKVATRVWVVGIGPGEDIR